MKTLFITIRLCLLFICFCESSAALDYTSTSTETACAEAITKYQKVKHRLTDLSERDIRELYESALSDGNDAEMDALLDSAQILNYRRNQFLVLAHMADEAFRTHSAGLSTEVGAQVVSRVFPSAADNQKSLLVEALMDLSSEGPPIDGDRLRAMVENKLIERLLEVGLRGPGATELVVDDDSSHEDPKDSSEPTPSLANPPHWLSELIDHAVQPRAFRSFLIDLQRRPVKTQRQVMKALGEVATSGTSRVSYFSKHTHDVLEISPKGSTIRILYGLEATGPRMIAGYVNPKAGSDRGGARERNIFENAVSTWANRKR